MEDVMISNYENVQCNTQKKNASPEPIENSEIQERAYTLCKEYMRGVWDQIPKGELQVKVLGGGLTNKLYVCKIPKCRRNTKDKNSPHTVVLRLYGLIIQDFKAQIQESVVFSILSERKIGPQLYAVFPGGRLEEYIPCRPLTTRELSDPAISRFIARRMASYHRMVMPVKKEPTTLMNKLRLYLEGIEHLAFEDGDKALMLEEFRKFDVKNELEYVKNLLDLTASPVVFCHNDVQEGNLLYSKKKCTHANPIQMIDFEYSCYNYRGFDLGNHFCEWMCDYSYPKWPCYTYNFEDYPTKYQQATFIEAYIEEQSTRLSASDAHDNFQVEAMIREANRFALFSHLFWAAWSVVQARMSDIGFGYMEYALSRMDAYFRHKENFE